MTRISNRTASYAGHRLPGAQRIGIIVGLTALLWAVIALAGATIGGALCAP